MGKFLVTTNRGTFEVEADKEPSAEELQSYLDATNPDKNEDSRARRMRIGESPSESIARGPREGGVGMGTAADVVLEGVLPAVGQGLATETTPAGMAAVGSGMSIIGNVLAQTRRVVMGDQKEFSGGQIAQAGATGAIPVAGPAANSARAARPIIKAIMDAGVVAVKQAGVGIGGEAIKTAIDEGRLPTAREATIAAVVPGMIGAAASGLSSAAQGIATRGRRVAENAADYGDIQATPGMLMPDELAGTEQRLARSRPGGKVAQRVDQTYGEMADRVQNVAPGPREGAEIFETASPLLHQISDAEKELAKLNEAARKANDKAHAAIQAVRQAETVVAGESKEAGMKAAKAASDEALNANLDSALQNAQEVATARLTGGDAGVDPATARTMFVEHVAKPIEAAFEEKSAQMYSLVDNKVLGFSATPIIANAERIASEVTGGLPKKLEASISTIRDVLGSDEKDMVSLQALRNARAELLRKVRVGEFGSNNEERLIKEIAADITKQIDEQAVKALGEEGGNALREANKFYRETRPLFDARGVDVLFTASPSDEVTRTMLNGMEKAGVNSDEYKNLQTLIAKIGESNPELAKQAQAHVADTLKRSIIFDASRVSPASPTGELMVDTGALVDRLDKMARIPGTLEAMNLGTPAKVAELKKLTASYPEAAKMTSQQWTALLESPAFAEASSGKLATSLEPVLAVSQAEQQLVLAANLRAGGKIERARAAYDRALETVRKIGGDVQEARALYERAVKDPAAVAMNNPGLGKEGFNDFANTLFNPKANSVTNKDVQAVADALRESTVPANRALLTRLQERYIADKIAAYHSTPPTSNMLRHPDGDAVALFFNPVNFADAGNEINRARALLSPEQFQALTDFARTAKAVTQYEKFGIVPVKSGSYDIPVVGAIRRGLDAIADLYREGKYELAAKLLADPAKFSRIAVRVGDTGSAAATGAQRSAQGTGRVVDEEQKRDVRGVLYKPVLAR